MTEPRVNPAFWFVAPALAAIGALLLRAGGGVPRPLAHRLRHLRRRRSSRTCASSGSRTTAGSSTTPPSGRRCATPRTSWWSARRSRSRPPSPRRCCSRAASCAGRRCFRTIYFLPVVTTLVAVAVVWRFLYHPRVGPLARLFEAVGLPAIDWLGDPAFAMPAIILLAVWKGFGFNMVIFVAGLQAIPERLYEAARLDGASAAQQFRHVTLPMLAPTTSFVLLMTLIGHFQLFAEPYVMTQGGPGDATRSIVLLMYEQGFRWWSLGQAAAIAFVLFGIILAVSLAARAAGLLGGGRRGGALVRRRALAALLYAVLVAGAALTLAPLLWMLSVSLMPAGEATALPPRLLPSAPTLENYRALFTRLHLARSFANSLLLAGAATAVSLVLNALAGYAFARLRFPGRDRLFRLLLAALVMPGQVGMLPLFLLLKEMGLVNSYLGVLVPGPRQHLRHLPGPPVLPRHSPERARRGARRRRRRAAHLVVDRAAALPADPRDPRDLHLHGQLERLPVAADRADRRGSPHAPRRPREPAGRARAGPRADDGGLGADRAARSSCCSRCSSASTSRASSAGACAGERGRRSPAAPALRRGAGASARRSARSPRRDAERLPRAPRPRRAARAPTRAGCRASRATGRWSACPSTRRRRRSPRTAPSRSRRRPSASSRSSTSRRDGAKGEGRLVSWRDVRASQELLEGDLPIPSVALGGATALALTVRAFAAGPPGGSSLFATYRVENRGAAPLRGSLFLAVRPIQVISAWQFLNLSPGFAPIYELGFEDGRAAGERREGGARPLTPLRRLRRRHAPATASSPTRCARASCRRAPPRATPRASSRARSASPSSSRRARRATCEVEVPFYAGARAARGRAGRRGGAPRRPSRRRAAPGAPCSRASRIDLPPPADAFERTARSSVAWILVHRDGPQLQPGSRCYERSWIRDGALTSAALLAFGFDEEVREFLRWYAPHQFADGKIPCCIDARGADPTPEHDSRRRVRLRRGRVPAHDAGREPRPRALAPRRRGRRVPRARCARERTTPAFRAPDKRAFFGLLPESISHEGYAKRPVHSFWDDLFALRGFQDAAWLAARARRDGARRSAGARSPPTFQRDVAASMSRDDGARRHRAPPGLGRARGLRPDGHRRLARDGRRRRRRSPSRACAAPSTTTAQELERRIARNAGARRLRALRDPHRRRLRASRPARARRGAARASSSPIGARRGWNQWPEILWRDAARSAVPRRPAPRLDRLDLPPRAALARSSTSARPTAPWCVAAGRAERPGSPEARRCASRAPDRVGRARPRDARRRRRACSAPASTGLRRRRGAWSSRRRCRGRRAPPSSAGRRCRSSRGDASRCARFPPTWRSATRRGGVLELPPLERPGDPAPHARVLSNGRWTALATGAGTGYSAWRGLCATRFDADRTEDPCGVFVYLRDLESGSFVSVG